MEKKRIVVITGAGGGLGKVLVRMFLDKGDVVCGVDLGKQRFEEAFKADIKNPNLKFKAVDFSHSEDVKNLGKYLIDYYGRVDILINNAGVNKITPIENISSGEWDYIMNVNLRGPFELCQSLLSTFMSQKSGKIINISSPAAIVGGAIVGTHYSVSKSGLECLTRMLAKHLARYSVTVNAVRPGPMNTDFHKETTPEKRKRIASSNPMGRFAEAVEIAHAVLFLSSDQANYITGEVFNVNGGLIMG